MPSACFTILPFAGHYYEFVSLSNAATFASLYSMASARNFRGVSGHVLTVTGQGEQTFVAGLLQQAMNSTQATLAAFDGQRIGATNSFKYTAGPEAGIPFTFTNWDDYSPITNQPQPDSAVTGFNCLLMELQTGLWSDQNCFDTVSAYMVEYECPAGFLFNATGCYGLIFLNCA